MKNLFLFLLPLLTFGFASCSSDSDSGSDHVVTDYYQISMGMSYGGTTQAPGGLSDAIKNIYLQKLSQVCKSTKNGYTTTKSESEVVATIATAETAAQTERNKYDWKGEITVTLIHVTKSDQTKPYTHSFSQESTTMFTLTKKIEVVDTLCCALSTQQLTTFHTQFDCNSTVKVKGEDAVSNYFHSVRDSIKQVLIGLTKSFNDNQSIVVKYQQTDTAGIIKKPCFIIVSRDSSNTATSVALVKETYQATYRLYSDIVPGNARVDVYSDYYLPKLKEQCTKTGGIMRFNLKQYEPDVVKSDSMFRSIMKNLEKGAEEYMKPLSWTSYSLKVNRESFFGNKENIYSFNLTK